MTHRGGALLLAAAVCVATASCSTPGATPSGPAAAPTATAPTPSGGNSMTTITIEVQGRAMPVELYDNPTARDLAGRLPVTVTFRDYASAEKIGPLSPPLSMEGAPSRGAPKVGELGWYDGNDVLVLYYAHVDPYPGIVPLGRLSEADMAHLSTLPDGFTAVLDRANS